MMSRYQSRYRWQKVEAGHYVSPDGKYSAWRPDIGQTWNLYTNARHYQWDQVGTYLSLADCQEIAAKRERDKWTTV